MAKTYLEEFECSSSNALGSTSITDEIALHMAGVREENTYMGIEIDKMWDSKKYFPGDGKTVPTKIVQFKIYQQRHANR